MFKSINNIIKSINNNKLFSYSVYIIITIMTMLGLLILFVLNYGSIENFSQFHEPSDNYNLKKRTDYYKKLRNTIGCSNIF